MSGPEFVAIFVAIIAIALFWAICVQGAQSLGELETSDDDWRDEAPEWSRVEGIR